MAQSIGSKIKEIAKKKGFPPPEEEEEEEEGDENDEKDESDDDDAGTEPAGSKNEKGKKVPPLKKWAFQKK